MPWVAGVDGAKAGWLPVSAPSGGGWIEAALVPRWADLALARAVMIGVDMPIGPPESRPRARDSAARRLLYQGPQVQRLSAAAPGANSPRRPQLACAACALAARDMLRGRATRLPPEPPLDARGFKMEIWY